MRRFIRAAIVGAAATGFTVAIGHAETVRSAGIFRGPSAAQDCVVAKSAVTDSRLTAFCDHLAPEEFQLITVPTSQVPKFLMIRAEAGSLDRLG